MENPEKNENKVENDEGLGIIKGLSKLNDDIDEMELKTDLEMINYKRSRTCQGSLIWFFSHELPMFFHFWGSDKDWRRKECGQTFADDVEVTCLEEERHLPNQNRRIFR